MKRTSPRPFDPDWLRVQLETNVLKGSWHLPRKGELEKLATDLNALEPQIRRLMLSRTLYKDFGRVIKAMNIVHSEAPDFIRICGLGRSDESVEEQIKEFQEHLQSARTIVMSYVSSAVLRISSSARREQKWKRFAWTIAQLFVSCISKANPNRDIGYSSGGPASRFVHLVVPKFTGETPALESVSAQLKQDARRHREEIKRLTLLQAYDPEVPF